MPATLAVPLNTTVAHPPPPDIVVTEVLEPTAKKPPDGWGRESTNMMAREPAGGGGFGVEGEKIADGRVTNANGLTSYSPCEPAVVGDRSCEIVVLPPTKHPTPIHPTPSHTYSRPHDDERPPAIKHPIVRAAYSLPRERSPCTANSSIPPWVDRLVRSLRLNDLSIVIQSSSRTNVRPARTKHPKTREGVSPIPTPSSPLSMHGLAYSSCRAHPFVNDDRSAPTKHPRVRFLASSTIVLSISALARHSMRAGYYGSPLGADERIKPAKHSVTSVHDPPITQPRPRVSMHDCRHPSCTGRSPIVTQSLHHNDRPSPIKHPTPETVLLVNNDLTAAATYTDARLPANDRPRPTKHPTTRANTSFVAIAPTVSPLVHVVTRSARFVQPPLDDDRLPPTEHPTMCPSYSIDSHIAVQQLDDEERPSTVKHRAPLVTGITIEPYSLPDRINDRPALTKHPTTPRATPQSHSRSSVDEYSSCTTGPSVVRRPRTSKNRPAPTKHPTPIASGPWRRVVEHTLVHTASSAFFSLFFFEAVFLQ
ncbi:hypothetical protein BOTBODRAFT_179663 [Botryobasidium botryosum FD-172 SS1]|uniref:Uncharacterized protein n=1 Tax=Botryobasidium botryosum (strain FD-172 SS1) TaxID=930990 RepID=A0A067MAF1_BOTB1|nr:hypothetical protein BOTBODRAFT_179663 [Botryobasidium botryosum FD-172 SS1]